MTDQSTTQEERIAAVWKRTADDLAAKLATADERLAEGRFLIEAMDVRMQEGAAVDEDGWIIGYRLPTGPWHKLIAWARQGESNDD
jgi:hypothetical protein